MNFANVGSRSIATVAIAVAAFSQGISHAAPIVFSAAGDNTPASIQSTVDAFRAALGDPNNGNAPGPLAGGRREINWDGGGAATNTTPPATPFDVFLNTRGARFTTPGTGLTQATPEGLGDLVLNPTYATTFSVFSPLRLFAPVGSNITDGLFFLPGSGGATPATVAGFGAVFTDVDLPDITSIEYFDVGGSSLFKGFVPVDNIADGGLSFFGVLFDAGERVRSVRITTGNAELGPDDSSSVDVVAMDDFFYGEPVAFVASPATLSLFAIAMLGMLASRRR